MIVMKTRNEYIDLLKSCGGVLRKQFGVRSLRLFGSVDVCVVTETPNPFLIQDIKEFLEKLFDCPVDVIRYRESMNPFLKKQIEKDGIYVL